MAWHFFFHFAAKEPARWPSAAGNAADVGYSDNLCQSRQFGVICWLAGVGAVRQYIVGPVAVGRCSRQYAICGAVAELGNPAWTCCRATPEWVCYQSGKRPYLCNCWCGDGICAGHVATPFSADD